MVILYLVLLASIVLMAFVFRLAFYFNHQKWGEFLWFAFGMFFNQDKRVLTSVRRLSSMVICISWVCFSWIVILFYQVKWGDKVGGNLGRIEILSDGAIATWRRFPGPARSSRRNGIPRLDRCSKRERLWTGLVLQAGAVPTIRSNQGAGEAARDLARRWCGVDGRAHERLSCWVRGIHRRFGPVRHFRLWYVQADSVHSRFETVLWDAGLCHEPVSHELHLDQRFRNLTVELEKVNRALSQVLSSYSTIRGRYVPPYNAYRDEVDTDEIILTNIHLKDLYNLVAFLTALSVLAFLVEHFYYQSGWRWYSFADEEHGRWRLVIYVNRMQRIIESYWYKDIRL